MQNTQHTVLIGGIVEKIDGEKYGWLEMAAAHNPAETIYYNNSSDWGNGFIGTTREARKMVDEMGGDFEDFEIEPIEIINSETLSLMDDYNAAYGVDVSRLDDDGFNLYRKFAGLIETGAAVGARWKKTGTATHPDDLKIILRENQGTWSPVVFENENESLFDLCRASSVEYPFGFKQARISRLNNAAYQTKQANARNARQISSELKNVNTEIEEMEKRLVELKSNKTKLESKLDAAIEIQTSRDASVDRELAAKMEVK